MKRKANQKTRLTINTTLEEAEQLQQDAFAIPEARRYPIHNQDAARLSLERATRLGNAEDIEKVTAAVEAKYPELNQKFTTNNLQSFTFNAGPTVRNELMEGRKYAVVPMVMLTEGVHAGSNGPLYYPKDELAKTPAVWNHKPIVVYHPQMNGLAISACEPAVISRRKVGLIFNTKFTPGKNGAPGRLTAEAWIDVERAKGVDKRVWDAIQNKKMMEVSTGLFTDNERVVGEWNKEKYSAVARNYRPDHLALLPDEKGACSISDGAGLMRNSESSFDDIRSQLNDLVQSRNKDSSAKGGPYIASPWVNDVFGTFCVYQTGKRMMKQGYTIDDAGKVSLSGAPEEVVRKTTYKTADGKVINISNKEPPMTKEELVGDLIANADTHWEESDRDFLMEMDKGNLKKMLPVTNRVGGDTATDGKDDDGDDGELSSAKTKVKAKKQSSQSSAALNKGDMKGGQTQTDDEDDDDEDDAGTRNQAQTVDQYINNAPPEIQDVLRSGYRAHTVQKEKLIAQIVANKANLFEEDYLASKDLEELQAIAALATNGTSARAPRFIGQGNDAGGGPVENAEGGRNITALPVPTMTFNRKTA